MSRYNSKRFEILVLACRACGEAVPVDEAREHRCKVYDDVDDYCGPRRCQRHGVVIGSEDGRFDGLCPQCEAEADQPDESMDGDHASALASAGLGTDEDYGSFGDND